METISEPTLWPPQYVIRTSLKAKRPFLQISAERGLEVVVPVRKRAPNIEPLLNEKRRWIEKNLQKFTQTIASFSQSSSGVDLPLPQEITCLATGEIWSILYQPIPDAKQIRLTTIQTPDPMLILKGKTTTFQHCRPILIQWLIRHAQSQLIPWLERLSQETELSFTKAIIRGQTTLWGSCNAHKTISLNYKLLFLPQHVVQHVLLHELCHIKHLNHSQRFWQLLKKFDADYLENRAQLKKGHQYLPHWLMT